MFKTGFSAQAGAFSANVIQAMSTINQRPIIFALSNPTSKSECSAQQAFTHSNGQVLFCSGSPFEAFKYNNTIIHPSQGNNCLHYFFFKLLIKILK